MQHGNGEQLLWEGAAAFLLQRFRRQGALIQQAAARLLC
jgi:hypothetical protein